MSEVDGSVRVGAAVRMVAGLVGAWKPCGRAEFAIRMERTWMHAVLPAAMMSECSSVTPSMALSPAALYD